MANMSDELKCKPIANMFIRDEYQWDRMGDIDWNLLRNNLAAANRVLDNPEKFPHANFKYMELRADAIESFLRVHPEF